MSVRKTLVTLIYMACCILMYFLHEGGITIAGINFMYYYLMALIGVVFVFGCFLVNPDVGRLLVAGRYVLILASPYLFSMFYSMLIWILTLTPFRVMLRGFFQPSYQILAICMAAAAVYLFGEKGVYYQLAGLFAGYLLIFAQLIASGGGVGNFIREYIQLIVTRGSVLGPMMESIEDMAYAHGMGFFILFLVFTWKENQYNLLFLIPALMFFMSGYKRSALLGWVLAFAFFVMCRVVPKGIRKAAVILGGMFLAIGGIIYIWLLAKGLVDLIFEKIGVDSMGRSEIYNAMRPYYEFTPVYLGKGLGYVNYSIGAGLINVGNEMRGDIHNDLLRQYIELGMVGYFIWLALFCVWRLKELMKRADVQLGLFALMSFAYAFGCYATENMYYRFNTTLAFGAVLLSYAVQREKKAKE